MKNSIQEISLIGILISMIPLVLTGIIYQSWLKKGRMVSYASARMVMQLLAIGYILTFIFNSKSPVTGLAVLIVMILSSSWIALRPLERKQKPAYFKLALTAICVGSLPILLLYIFAVLQLSPWYQPRYIIPLAGMIFSNAMNAVSLCIDRYISEIESHGKHDKARMAALRTSLLPKTNMFLAVGLVSLPGMMTGQILAGASPLIAVRYQIMIMCGLFGSAGIAAATYLVLAAKEKTRTNPTSSKASSK